MNQPTNIVHLRQSYQLKILLSNIRPPIWRRLVVDSRIPLDALHDAIQISMGWDDCHMHQFIGRNGVLYSEAMDDDFIDIPGRRTLDESEVLLNEVLNAEKDWLTYEYDFGDGWSHKITLEKILPHEKNQFPVVCIKGKRSCPPEDCGGPWGYQNLLEQLENPDGEEYEELMDWLGDMFDADNFDRQSVNEFLQDFFEGVIFNAKPGLENALKRNNADDDDSFLPAGLQSGNLDDLFAGEADLLSMNTGIDEMVRELLDDKELPEEIKELIDGMQNMLGVLSYMEVLIEQSTEAFEEIRMLSKDKKVIALADKMLRTLEDD